jgi:hypothetical protein
LRPEAHPTRIPLSGIDRVHADRLCTRRLLASLADAIGLPATSSASSRLRLCSRLRHLHPSHCIPARRQSQRAQYLSFSATSPVSAGHKEWLVCMGVSPAIPGSDSRRRPVRIRRVGHQWATRGQDHEGHIAKDRVHLFAPLPPQVTMSRLLQWLRACRKITFTI